jgi:hypothetical protein
MPPVPWLRTASEPLVSTELRLPNIAPERLRLIEFVCRTSMKRYGYEAAELKNPPGTASTMARIASETPETARYLWRVIRMFNNMRNAQTWGSLPYVKMYYGLNPPWWTENKDLALPIAPKLIEEPALPEAGRSLP